MTPRFYTNIRFKKIIGFVILFSIFLSGYAFACAPKDSPNDEEPLVGDPVSVTSGRVYISHNDLTIPGRGALPLEITRNYYSKSDYYGLLGRRWSFTYEMALYFEGYYYYVRLINEEGKRELYYWNGGTSWRAPVGNFSTLTKNPDDSWTLKRKNGIIYNFDSSGKLLSIQDRNGNLINLAYTDGRLTSVTDDNGRSLTFSYNGSGLIASITWPNNEVTSYAYDGNHNLSNVTDPEGNQIYYSYFSYDTNWDLITVTDARNNAISYTYYNIPGDSNYLKCKRITYADGTYMDLLYNESLRFTLVTDERGYTTKYVYDGNENITAVTDPLNNMTTTVYDADFNKTSITNARGFITNYTYDTKGNRLSERDPLNRIKNFTYEPNYSFVKTTTDPKGNITTYYYDYEESTLGDLNGDGITNQTTGNLVKIVYPAVTAGTPTETFVYNQFGQIIQQTDPKGIITKYDYYPATGYLEKKTVDYGDTTHINAVTQFTYDTLGNVISVADPLNRITNLQYNKIGLLLKSIAPAPFNYQTKYSYDGNDNLIKIERQQDEAGANWKITENTYDKRDQLTAVKEYISPTNYITTTFHYDAAGNKDSQTDSNGNTTTYTYDERSLLIKVQDAESNISEYSYYQDGKLRTIKDAKGNITFYEYDNSGWLIRTIYPDSSYEEYTPDLNSNIAYKRTRKGDYISYTYDNLNRLISKSFPNSSNFVYSYDIGGNLSSVTGSADSSLTTYIYDGLNRLKSYSLSIGGEGRGEVVYDYNPLGLRTKLTYPDESFITYNYDELNRLTGINDQSGSPVASYDYDPLGRRTMLDYANGITTNYAYDDFDNLSLITHNSSLVTGFSYTYDNVGNRLSKQMTENGVQSTENYTYDKIYQLKFCSLSIGGEGRGEVGYVYDSVGNRISQDNADEYYTYTTNELNQYTALKKTKETIPIGGQVTPSVTRVDVNGVDAPIGQDRTFSANILLNEGPNSITATAYDSLNRPGEDTISLTLQAKPVNFSYDLNGNMTSRSVADSQTAYAYDYENRLISVSLSAGGEGGGEVGYSYDYLGRRTSKTVTVNSVLSTVYYCYDGDNLIAEYDSAGNFLKKYIYGSNIDELISSTHRGEGGGEGAKYFYHQDGLGSVIDITDSNGSLIEHYDYDAFGSFTIRSPLNAIRSESAIGNRFYFTGRELDSETGLYYYRARYYDPKLGRFLQADPVGYIAGVNLYRYVRNNPVNFIDPLGLSPEDKKEESNNPINKSLKTLKKTEWAKTKAGKKAMKVLEEADAEDKINIGDARGARAYYNTRTGEIVIDKKTDFNDIPGRMAHEGTHGTQNPKDYGLKSERGAYDAGYAVDKELNRPGAYNPTDEEIKNAYGFE